MHFWEWSKIVLQTLVWKIWTQYMGPHTHSKEQNMSGHNTANWTCSKETFCKSINTILNWNLFSILKIEVATNAFFFRRFYAWLTSIFWDNSSFRVFLAVFSSFNISPKASLFPKLPVQSNDCRDAKKKRKEHRVSTEIHNTQEVLKGMIHFT